jgi:hypothetical protein
VHKPHFKQAKFIIESTETFRNKTTSSDQSLSTKNTTVAVIDSEKYKELSSEVREGATGR